MTKPGTEGDYQPTAQRPSKERDDTRGAPLETHQAPTITCGCLTDAIRLDLYRFASVLRKRGFDWPDVADRMKRLLAAMAGDVVGEMQRKFVDLEAKRELKKRRENRPRKRLGRKPKRR